MKMDISKFAEAFIEPAQLQLQALNGQTLNPLNKNCLRHGMIEPRAGYLISGMKPLIEHGSLPENMNGFGKKGLKDKHRYLSPGGNHGTSTRRNTLQNNMQDYFIIPRIPVVSMIDPVKKSAVDFDVAAICNTADL
jgi:hypothetical protein